MASRSRQCSPFCSHALTHIPLPLKVPAQDSFPGAPPTSPPPAPGAEAVDHTLERDARPSRSWRPEDSRSRADPRHRGAGLTLSAGGKADWVIRAHSTSGEPAPRLCGRFPHDGGLTTPHMLLEDARSVQPCAASPGLATEAGPRSTGISNGSLRLGRRVDGTQGELEPGSGHTDAELISAATAAGGWTQGIPRAPMSLSLCPNPGNGQRDLG